MLDSAGITDPIIQVAATSSTGPEPVPLVVKAPAAGEHLAVNVASGQQLIFEFNPLDVHSSVSHGDLVLDFPNGGKLVLHNVQSGAVLDSPTLVTLPDGVTLSTADLLQALNLNDIVLAAGDGRETLANIADPPQSPDAIIADSSRGPAGNGTAGNFEGTDSLSTPRTSPSAITPIALSSRQRTGTATTAPSA